MKKKGINEMRTSEGYKEEGRIRIKEVMDASRSIGVNGVIHEHTLRVGIACV